MSLPANLAAIRDEAMRTSCEAWALRKRWVLARGIDRAGPCPMCGGTDRFAIHTKKNTFNCRGCGISGAGVIDLVMATEGVEFLAACEIVTGRKAEAEPDPARMEALRAEADAAEAARAAEAERYREKAREAAYRTWKRAYPVRWDSMFDGPVVEYLRLRGIDFPGVTARSIGNQVKLGEIERHPWKEQRGDTWVTVHEGPAMLAAVQRPDRSFGAVHITWLDLAQPKGKLVLPPRETISTPRSGEDANRLGGPGADGVVTAHERPSKKVLGAKKGGAIRLYTPPDRCTKIVMGEGIETTLTALAHAYDYETAYWAGVDLGNMAGRARRNADGGQVWAEPDLDDRDCFLPPVWCEELIYLCDSDEPSQHTEEKVVRGLRRAQLLRDAAIADGLDAPPLRASYVPPLGGGMDLNDLVRVTG